MGKNLGAAIAQQKLEKFNLCRIATERFGVERTQVWNGWIMSNWIDITIREEGK